MRYWYTKVTKLRFWTRFWYRMYSIIGKPIDGYDAEQGCGCGAGVGVGVGVARSRGNEPGVGVGADQAALTPTLERLLRFVASLAHAAIRICCLSWKYILKMFCFFVNNNFWHLYKNFVAAYIQHHMSVSLFTLGKSEEPDFPPPPLDASVASQWFVFQICPFVLI